jgi:hypothetical protein
MFSPNGITPNNRVMNLEHSSILVGQEEQIIGPLTLDLAKQN